MVELSESRRVPLSIPLKVRPAIRALLYAFEYAEDVEGDRWEFAVAIRHLEKLGCTETDLRWLARKGYAEHAREITLPGANGRQFQPTGDLTFCRRTCFVLTAVGACQARRGFGAGGLSAEAQCAAGEDQDSDRANSRPYWDAETRILRVDGMIVKCFKWRAENQETILTAFQEESWRRRIDDPLPPKPEQDSKRRLSDTIKCLNRKQMRQLIHFRGDGTGQGVVWELVNSDAQLDSDQ
jgi:hypothetical protein